MDSWGLWTGSQVCQLQEIRRGPHTRDRLLDSVLLTQLVFWKQLLCSGLVSFSVCVRLRSTGLPRGTNQPRFPCRASPRGRKQETASSDQCWDSGKHLRGTDKRAVTHPLRGGRRRLGETFSMECIHRLFLASSIHDENLGRGNRSEQARL